MTIPEAKRAAGIIERRRLIHGRQQIGQSVSAWRPCSAYCLSARSGTRTLRLMICSHGQKNEVVVLGRVSAGNAAFLYRGIIERLHKKSSTAANETQYLKILRRARH